MCVNVCEGWKTTSDVISHMMTIFLLAGGSLTGLGLDK